MNNRFQVSKNEQKDRIKSAIITFILSIIVFLYMFFYKFEKIINIPNEIISTMLINFGENKIGENTEEPKNQEIKLGAVDNSVRTPKENSSPTNIKKEKILTNENSKVNISTTKKPKENSKIEIDKPKINNNKNVSTKTEVAKTKSQIQGDAKGTAAIGNLIRGKGNSESSQGNKDGIIGNVGDPIGGGGDGNSKIGVDRKLIAYIPGTMGRGGTQPNHNCTTSGSINIAYIVDKNGNVISANRNSGLSDSCAVSTCINWVKKYVKADKGNSKASGIYKIIF